MRRFEWTAAETGLKFGLVLLLAGVLGSVAGGAIAARARARGLLTANIDIALPAILLVAPFSVAGFLATNPTAALALLAIAWGCYSMPVGLLMGAIQDVAPPHLRGRTAAIYYLVIGVLGLTLGPLLVALLTDRVFLRPEDVGKSLAVVAGLLAPLSAFAMFLGRNDFRLAVRGS